MLSERCTGQRELKQMRIATDMMGAKSCIGFCSECGANLAVVKLEVLYRPKNEEKLITAWECSIDTCQKDSKH